MDAVYIHIPFCIKKCGYCDFLSFSNLTYDEKEKYVSYVVKEIELYEKEIPNKIYDTVYFGGGTPSILEVKELEKILKKFRIKENSEITIEVNPKTVNLEKLIEIRKIGINRISIGIQSFNEKYLKLLGRQHNTHEAITTYENARLAGFENISLDLMFSLPGQTMEELEEDLEKLFKLNPEHFSIYSLIWEEGTDFFEKLEKGEFIETDNDLEADMYKLIIDKSKEKGYIHYEISNFSKEGKEAKHNTKYWKNQEYLGIGLGAAGYLGEFRYKNVKNFNEYYDMIDLNKLPVENLEKIDYTSKESYKNMLELRLLKEGTIPSLEYKEKFDELLRGGYLIKNGDRYILSEKGLFLANDVFQELI